MKNLLTIRSVSALLSTGAVLLVASCSEQALDPYQEQLRTLETGHWMDLEKSYFTTEQEFIIYDISSRIAQVANLIRKSNPSSGSSQIESIRVRQIEDSDPPEFMIQLTDSKGSQTENRLRAEVYLWNPEVFQKLVSTLTTGINKNFKPTAQVDAMSDEALLSELLTVSDETIQKMNKSISEKLRIHPADPAAHQQAALLSAFWGCQEVDSRMQDLRPSLSRASAHMALAREFSDGQKLSVAGNLAELLILNSSGRQTDAFARIKSLEESGGGELVSNFSDPNVFTRWLRSIRMLVTEDWRLADPQQELSTLERNLGFRFYSARVSSIVAAVRYDDESLFRHVEFNRTTSRENYEVQVGHILLDQGFNNEFRSIKRVLNVFSDKEVPSALIESSRPGLSDSFEVISRWDWELYFQRNLAQTIRGISIFLRNKIADPESAKALGTQIISEYGKVPMVQLLGYYLEGPAKQRDEMHVALRESILTTPEIMPMGQWCKGYFELKDYFQPNPSFFFKETLPYGSSLQVNLRYSLISKLGGRREKILKTALDIRPYDYNLGVSYLNNEADREVAAKLSTQREITEPYFEYTKYAMDFIKNHPETSMDETDQIYERIIELDPDRLVYYGDFLLTRGEEKRALEMFERAQEEMLDKVLLANKSQWLVEYYFKNGLTEKAMAVAYRAGETYSSRGLETLGYALCENGEWDKAQTIYEAASERYPKSISAAKFYNKAAERTGKLKYARLYEQSAADRFINGLQKVTLEDFTNPPAMGVLIDGDSPHLKAANLGSGAVIVACYGYRVDTIEQYNFLKDTHETSELDLIVYYQDEYRSVITSPPKKLFGVKINSLSHLGYQKRP